MLFFVFSCVYKKKVVTLPRKVCEFDKYNMMKRQYTPPIVESLAMRPGQILCASGSGFKAEIGDYGDPGAGGGFIQP